MEYFVSNLGTSFRLVGVATMLWGR